MSHSRTQNQGVSGLEGTHLSGHIGTQLSNEIVTLPFNILSPAIQSHSQILAKLPATIENAPARSLRVRTKVQIKITNELIPESVDKLQFPLPLTVPVL